MVVARTKRGGQHIQTKEPGAASLDPHEVATQRHKLAEMVRSRMRWHADTAGLPEAKAVGEALTSWEPLSPQDFFSERRRAQR
jgi:hypothetical protein